jgi:hypothetical protein
VGIAVLKKKAAANQGNVTVGPKTVLRKKNN